MDGNILNIEVISTYPAEEEKYLEKRDCKRDGNPFGASSDVTTQDKYLSMLFEVN